MKLWALPFGGGRSGAIPVAPTPPASRAGRAGRLSRVRELILATALASMFALLALALTSGALELPVVPVPEGFFEIEPILGLSRLQIISVASAAAAALLLSRRMRLARRRRSFMPSPAEMATQTALVAAWVEKAAREVIDRPGQVPGEKAYQPDHDAATPIQTAAFAPPRPTTDPVAAADFMKWGQEAARAGDRLVAHRLFLHATRLDYHSEAAWLWLAGTTDNREEALDALERVLHINPQNFNARQGLDELTV